MSLENRLWGAPHIHGELLRLGFTVAQSTVAKYVAKPGDGRSGQNWGTFLRNHLPHIAAMDLFVVPTITFVQPLRPSHCSSGSARAGLGKCDGASDGRLDSAADHRGLGGQILAYVLYEDESVRRDLMKRLTKDEARRIAANIAKLPELLGAAKVS
jgi:hypothetical protein